MNQKKMWMMHKVYLKDKRTFTTQAFDAGCLCFVWHMISSVMPGTEPTTVNNPLPLLLCSSQ